MVYKVKKIEIWDKYVEADSEEEALKKETDFLEEWAECQFEALMSIEEV
jgi:hypothetical protein